MYLRNRPGRKKEGKKRIYKMNDDGVDTKLLSKNINIICSI